MVGYTSSGGGLADIIFGDALCNSIKVEAFLPSTCRDFLFGATDMVEIFGTLITGCSGILLLIIETRLFSHFLSVKGEFLEAFPWSLNLF
jgi:hypothetical protein